MAIGGGFGASWNELIVGFGVAIPTTGEAAKLTYNVVNNEVIINDCNKDDDGGHRDPH